MVQLRIVALESLLLRQGGGNDWTQCASGDAFGRKVAAVLDEGVYATVSEIGDAENISKSYVSRILRLALLAPDIVEQVLEERAGHTPILNQLEQPLPANWEEQRHLIG